MSTLTKADGVGTKFCLDDNGVPLGWLRPMGEKVFAKTDEASTMVDDEAAAQKWLDEQAAAAAAKAAVKAAADAAEAAEVSRLKGVASVDDIAAELADAAKTYLASGDATDMKRVMAEIEARKA